MTTAAELKRHWKLRGFIRVEGEHSMIGFCCATLVLIRFPKDRPNAGLRKDVFDKAVRGLVNDWVKTAKGQNKSLVVCTLNEHQTRAAEVLEDYGFESTDWALRPTPEPGYNRVKILWYYVKGQQEDLENE